MDVSVSNAAAVSVGYHHLETGETCDFHAERQAAVGDTGQPRQPDFPATPPGAAPVGPVDRPVFRIERIEGGRDGK